MQRRTLLASSIGAGAAASWLGLATPARATNDLVIDSLDNDITEDEIASFLAWMQEIIPGRSAVGNEYLYGTTGYTAWALHQMYELTNEISILDRLIAFCDTMLRHRNDNDGQIVMWTGQVEPVWRNQALDAQAQGYFGAENGFTAGLLALTARAILSRPDLWTTTPSGSTARGRYRQYANRFLHAADETLDAVVANFIDPGTLRCHVPDTDSYGALGTSFQNNRGLPMPWNVQAYLALGLTASADTHELLGNAMGRVSRHDAIVDAYLSWFRSTLVETTDDDGAPTYFWGYFAGRKTPEDTGHGDVDALGAYLGMKRQLGGITPAVVERLGNNWVHSINMGDNRFNLYVDGNGRYDRGYLRNYCLLLASHNADLYHVVADAFIANRDAVAIFPGLLGAIWVTIMWAKRNRHVGVFPT